MSVFNWLTTGLALLPAFLGMSASGTLAGDVSPPLAGQPADFSQVVGSYTLEATATPPEVGVGEAVRLTVRIRGRGPAAYQPRRPHLRLFPASVTRDFYLRPLPAEDRSEPAEHIWEFVYELRPKHAQVQKIPSLHLIYYDPVYRCYQTSYSRALPLRVRTSASEQPAALLAVPLPAAPTLYELAMGPSVLRRESLPAASFPVHGTLGWFLLVLGVVLPPLVAVVLARRHLPLSRRASARGLRSAARQLLAALEVQAKAEQLAPLLAEYLRRCWELPAGRFTPRETARWLRRRGVSAEQARQAAQLVQLCTAARFAPLPPAEASGIKEMIKSFIMNLESAS
jgi:hypothetical protein